MFTPDLLIQARRKPSPTKPKTEARRMKSRQQPRPKTRHPNQQRPQQQRRPWPIPTARKRSSSHPHHPAQNLLPRKNHSRSSRRRTNRGINPKEDTVADEEEVPVGTTMKAGTITNSSSCRSRIGTGTIAQMVSVTVEAVGYRLPRNRPRVNGILGPRHITMMVVVLRIRTMVEILARGMASLVPLMVAAVVIPIIPTHHLERETTVVVATEKGIGAATTTPLPHTVVVVAAAQEGADGSLPMAAVVVVAEAREVDEEAVVAVVGGVIGGEEEVDDRI
mmetsp:Transcript_8844/g.16183  ORF Transcript_8844/g.16183 Transcript_8844/m.16183 type:complete len:278 (+) Transcript_8844:2378-3211(+)